MTTGHDFAADSETLTPFRVLAAQEGVIPAPRSAHAIPPVRSRDELGIVNCSKRDDKNNSPAAAHFEFR